MKRLFKSQEDFTKQIVQVEYLETEQGNFKREWRKIIVQGKTRKAKGGWCEAGGYKAVGHRNERAFKIFFEGRFLYSVPVTKHIGPKQ